MIGTGMTTGMISAGIIGGRRIAARTVDVPAGRRFRRSCARGEAGSAILLVLFMAAAMIVAMSVVVPKLVTQGRRQREDELAWRGEQYVRAVRLYYRKYGRFPSNVEDFSKNPGNIHFLRKEYKEPMNETDGTWRFIYVGPGGQLIGSLTRKLPIGMVAIGGTGSFGGTTAGPQGAQGNSPSGSSSIFSGSSGGFGQSSQPAQNQPGAAQPPAQAPPPDASGAAPGTELGPDGAPLPPAPVAPKQGDANASTNDSTVFGGQIVGVASKIDRKSIRFYKGYGKYREWEFIWDPAEDAMAAGQVSGQGLLPTGTQPIGTNPIGTNPVGTSPIVTPPVTPPQPQ
jgi:hypothetical protein